MHAKVLYFIVFASGLIFMSSCLKIKDYADEPSVSFVSQTINENDDLIIEFNFTDGDGDFGLDQEDILSPPYNVDPYKQNLIINYYELQNGTWQRFGPDFLPISPFYISTNFSQRVNWIEPTGQNKAQIGSINHTIDEYFVSSTGFDTCRFEFFIYDRNLNKSNVEVTPFFLKP